MKRSLCVLLGWLISVPLYGADSQSEPKPIKVPFILMPTGHFLVSVKLNDKGPYKLIFDTGAPTMLINNRIAKDSGVLNKKSPKPLFAPFGAAGPIVIKELQVGEAKAEKVSAMVMDHPTVQTFSNYFKKEHGNIDGIVGFPFFARFKMTVDYQKKELTFVPNDYQPADVMQSMMNMMLGANRKAGPKIVAPQGYWGFTPKKESSDENEGVVIDKIVTDSPAAKAGLKVNDRLLTLDGRWTDSVEDTYLATSFVRPGKTVEVTLIRDGKTLTLKVTPEKGF